MASFIDSVESSMDLHTLNGCKRHNRFQRYEFWESKSLTKLLDAIQKDYVPVGKDIRKFTMLKKKQDNEKSRSEKDQFHESCIIFKIASTDVVILQYLAIKK